MTSTLAAADAPDGRVTLPAGNSRTLRTAAGGRWPALTRSVPVGVTLACIVVAAVVPIAAGQSGAPPARPAPLPRTFPEFEGTWVLDEQASTGRFTAAPGATVAFAITPLEVTLTRTRKLPEQRSNPPDNTPFRQVFRLDGTERPVMEGGRQLGGRLLLVSDALVFTTRETSSEGNVSIVTDAYSVDGDVLTARRQLVAVRAPGHIATMQEPSNNHPHTFVYRRSAAASGR